MVTVEDVRRLARTLPRTEEALVHDRVRFRVRGLVYVSFCRDETLMGFAFPKEQRDGLIASEPGKFLMPPGSDTRFNWVRVLMASLEPREMSELVIDAWRTVVPKRVDFERFGR